MDLYSAVFGRSDAVPHVLEALKLTEAAFNRFRDAFVVGNKLAVYARIGQRESYQHTHELLAKHPLFIETATCPRDNTYCLIWFRKPDDVDLARFDVGTLDMPARWKASEDHMREHGLSDELAAKLEALFGPALRAVEGGATIVRALDDDHPLKKVDPCTT